MVTLKVMIDKSSKIALWKRVLKLKKTEKTSQRCHNAYHGYNIHCISKAALLTQFCYSFLYGLLKNSRIQVSSKTANSLYPMFAHFNKTINIILGFCSPTLVARSYGHLVCIFVSDQPTLFGSCSLDIFYTVCDVWGS